MSKPVELTDSNFNDEVLNSDKPVLVDFWAEWCGPCRMVGPVVEELAGDYEGKGKVGKGGRGQQSTGVNAIWNTQHTFAFDLQKWRCCGPDCWSSTQGSSPKAA